MVVNSTSPKFVALILAAGKSRRFDGDKRFVALPDGSSLVSRQAAIFREIGVPYFFVCDEQAARVFTKLQERYLLAEDAADGMAATIANGIAQLNGGVDCALITPVDLPLQNASLIGELVKAWQAGEILRPRCRGRAGHPVLFDRRFFSALKELQGDDGAKPVLQQHLESLRFHETESIGCVQDMDTADDYFKLFGQPPP